MKIQVAIDNQVCPKWLIQSKAMLGRCIPSINEDTFKNSNIEGNKWDDLKKGVEHLANFLDLRGIGEKVLDDLVQNWWIILIGLIISSVVAFLWIILMRYHHHHHCSTIL